jgi:hypothetical protein
MISNAAYIKRIKVKNGNSISDGGGLLFQIGKKFLRNIIKEEP